MHVRRCAFTLVELLIVIGIIAIMVGVLLPTITAARRQAQLVHCASNLRELTSASMMHAMEHRGYMPLAGELIALPAGGNYNPDSQAQALGDPYRRRYTYAPVTDGGMLFAVYVIVPFPAALAPYMGIRGLPYEDWRKLDLILNDMQIYRRYQCPSADSYSKARVGSMPGDTTLEGQATMMTIKTQQGLLLAAWSSNSDYGFNEGVFGYHFDTRYSTRRLGGCVSRFRKPSSLVLFTDANQRQEPASYLLRDPWICWTPSLDSSGPITLADALTDSTKAVDRVMFDRNRHRGRINVGFADGHVQTLWIDERDLRQAYLLPQ